MVIMGSDCGVVYILDYSGIKDVVVMDTNKLIDQSRIDQLRMRERFFTDLAHQVLEDRFKDYSGREPRRVKHRIVEVDYSLIPILYAGAIRDLAEAEAGK